MTNFEALQKAKTKKEFFCVLFAFETDLKLFGGVDTMKWLDEEYDVKETAIKGIMVALKMAQEDNTDDK